MNNIEDSKPWYKFLWPWLLMLPPLASVIGGFVTFFLAGGPPQMVDDDPGPQTSIVQPLGDNDEGQHE